MEQIRCHINVPHKQPTRTAVHGIKPWWVAIAFRYQHLSNINKIGEAVHLVLQAASVIPLLRQSTATATYMMA